ncbi:MAG TPA: hypothetical protein VH600_02425 [Burkholderiales bacterium]|jgi:hypothetical protein
MDEEIRYPVCPYRNVPAAYQRFLGADSGGIERFFPAGELTQRVDGTLLIVRLRSKEAVSGAAQVVGELNTAVCSAWVFTVAAGQALAVAACSYLGFARELLHRA